MLRRLKALRERTDGSVIVEVALLAPLLIGMFMGVLQIGIGMQNYNALRGASADVARYAVINYQTSNRLTTSQLQDYANGVATQAPYGLTRSRLTVTIATASTQRVTGAVEYTMTMRYNVPTMLSLLGVSEIPITYSRPIFVIAP
ncbi:MULTISPECIES: TadE/TadG family type IV pilus assembly protein [unclassified Novosphingobium]|uniref:TadE/TadG family type IV pilus assembly protein n=1 Tax=unclassified Novosphingobium TaxID=2644732 RepID=UPI0025D20AAF|nr:MULTISPECIES: TadE/TadG family type IV pilus assembly protein [unclassified Novosphingobium]HQV02683.1 pilus assembly protein [Novosphingobium sp.]